MTGVVIKGDFSGMHRILSKLSNMRNLRAAIQKNVAAEALRQVQLGFKTGTDPDGVPWAPLKHRVGQPLRKTGRLNRSFNARPSGQGIAIGTNVVYAQYHQRGTRRMVARRMLPPGPRLGRTWERPVRAAIKATISQFWSSSR